MKGHREQFVTAILVVGALFKMANQNFFFFHLLLTPIIWPKTEPLKLYLLASSVRWDGSPADPPSLPLSCLKDAASKGKKHFVGRTLCLLAVGSVVLKDWYILSDFQGNLNSCFCELWSIKRKKKAFSGSQLALFVPRQKLTKIICTSKNVWIRVFNWLKLENRWHQRWC